VIKFDGKKFIIESNIRITFDYNSLDYIIINNELKIDRIYLANYAITFNSIEKIISHHSKNITKIVSTHNGHKEIIYMKNSVLHSLIGPAYTYLDSEVYSIDGTLFVSEDFYEKEEVIIELREKKLERILKIKQNEQKSKNHIS